MTKIILNGYLGRMGKVVRDLVAGDPDCEIVAGVDIATIGGGMTFPTSTELTDCDVPADVLIDFSNDASKQNLLEYGVRKKIPLVICTTGLSDGDLAAVREASRSVAVFLSANMSLGVNLLTNLLTRASKLLYDAGFDIEIIERHHNQKLDAPSGTALKLADTINSALGGGMDYVYDRSARREKRPRKEIGLHALRGGSVVGDHTVIFAGRDELIEFTHSTQSREVFGVGALKAALFLKDKPPGLYDMQDLINAL